MKPVSTKDSVEVYSTFAEVVLRVVAVKLLRSLYENCGERCMVAGLTVLQRCT